jgi:hypothetical protein
MRVKGTGDVSVAGTIRAGGSLVMGTGVAAGYYQDSNNGAYRAIVTGSVDGGYYFQNYGGSYTTMYIGLQGFYAGRVGIGTTTPGGLLTLNAGDTTSGGLRILCSAVSCGSGNRWDLSYGGYDANLNFWYNGTSMAYINRTSGAWQTSSDRDLKQDISKLTKYGIDDVMKLKPVTYEFKADSTNTPQIGFIAQDVQEIMPEFVSGKALDEGGKGLALNYAGMVTVLTKGMQDQQGEIDALKAQNADLLKRIEALEAKVK